MQEGSKRSIAVLGGGSWATALIKILCEDNDDIHIHWWMRSKEEASYVARFKHNRSYLSDVEIDLNRVTPTHEIKKSVEGVSIIFLVIPSAFIADALDDLSPKHFQHKIVVSAAKGMIPDTKLLPTEYLEKEFNVPSDNICIVAGPCHAEEVALERQSYLTIAGEKIENAQVIANLMECRFVKCSVIDDVIGAEFCAVMKNITAIACGIAHGLGYGDNFQAVLVSNSLVEIKRFLGTVNLRERNYSSSAYLGDILVTSYSQFSRNRTFGNMVGRGYSVKFAQMEMSMIAEGYYAVKSIMKLRKKYDIEMPITEAVFRVLYEKIAPRVEFALLASRMR